MKESTEASDFIKAAHHAGFRIVKEHGQYHLFSSSGSVTLDSSPDLFDLGPTIKTLLKAAGART